MRHDPLYLLLYVLVIVVVVVVIFWLVGAFR